MRDMFEAVIGLEVHVQLKTCTKMFTRIPYRYGENPNVLTNEVVMGLPGTLPVINKAAVLKTIQMGLMFGCKIPEITKWDRKNYFYPDSPKNYQISQLDQPLCDGGEVEIELEGPARNIQGQHRKVKLNRIHLEEDVGKLVHMDGVSLVDYNRAGAPLVEIVSEPDMHSSEEVFAYLKSLIMHLQYIDASDCDMEKGQLRCDANISIRPVGEKTLGTKVELKNLNSVSGVCSGVEFEIKRQIEIIKDGGKIFQETRRWDAETNTSTSMRSKEEAHDYRYFPDPDLMPLKIPSELRKSIQNSLPELPFRKQERYYEQYKLPYTITSVLCPEKPLATFFEQAVTHYEKNPQAIANWIANDLLREMTVDGGSIKWSELKITPQHIADLVRLIDSNILSKQSAKSVFSDMFKTGVTPEEIVERQGLKMTGNTDELKAVCQTVINDFPQPTAEFKSGKEKALNVLKGQVMKHMQGKVVATEVDRILRELLLA